MPKRRNPFDTMQEIKRFCPTVSHKRKHEEEQVSRKRHRGITKEYVDRIEKDNQLMKQACFDAGHAIEKLQNRIKELETLLCIQRTQMERFRINNDITVY